MALTCRWRSKEPSAASGAALSRCINRVQLFDHLVGAAKQRKWHRKPERLGGLEIDGHLDLGDLFHT